MRKLLLLITLAAGAVLLWPACRDNGEEASFCSGKGVVIGPDYRKCACCGGWLIEINGDTLVAWNVPEPFMESIRPNEFPLPVFLNWKDVIGPCQGGVIDVECIGRR